MTMLAETWRLQSCWTLLIADGKPSQRHVSEFVGDFGEPRAIYLDRDLIGAVVYSEDPLMAHSRKREREERLHQEQRILFRKT